MAAAPKLTPKEIGALFRSLAPRNTRRRHNDIEIKKRKQREKYIRVLRANGEMAFALEMIQDMLHMLHAMLGKQQFKTQDYRNSDVFGPDWRRELFGADALPSGGVKKRKTKKGRG